MVGDGATVSPNDDADSADQGQQVSAASPSDAEPLTEDAELPGHRLVLGGGRVIETRYDDPLDLLWLHCARRLGMTVVRSREVFAAWDGKGTLTIADERDYDADDCLAQLIFHEICHALVAGPEAWTQADWGLCNRDDRHIASEFATHRLQAALADRHGLRVFMGPTTEHRPYYDGLPDDALGPNDALGPGEPDGPKGMTGQGSGADEAIRAAARSGWERAISAPWSEPIEDALAATASIARALGAAAPEGALWHGPGQS